MRVSGILVPISLLVLAGCSSGWTSVPVDSVDTTLAAAPERARLTLDDGRVLELRVLRAEYPYLWGARLLGENMPSREMRIDLRSVTRIEIQRAARPED